MRVITLRPGETPKYNEIPSYLDLLQALQHFCKGYIETVEIKDGILAIVNEEGRLLGMDIACVVPSIRQSLCGPVVFCRHDDCEFAPIRDGDLEIVNKAIVLPGGDWF